jgi:hypothetical protein
MTKREFDKNTKVNYRMHMDDRTDYRLRRGQAPVTDRIASRAADMAWRNEPSFRALRAGKTLPTLGIGSHYRTIAVYNLANGLPLLAGVV